MNTIIRRTDRSIDETQADMVTDHVRDCDLVDGAGHPLTPGGQG